MCRWCNVNILCSSGQWALAWAPASQTPSISLVTLDFLSKTAKFYHVLLYRPRQRMKVKKCCQSPTGWSVSRPFIPMSKRFHQRTNGRPDSSFPAHFHSTAPEGACLATEGAPTTKKFDRKNDDDVWENS